CYLSGVTHHRVPPPTVSELTSEHDSLIPAATRSLMRLHAPPPSLRLSSTRRHQIRA
ncbi:hypothetical protein A2U01_0031599, partial [Trifolium medium]|nr:hypothetical protein [Trifolium medium]